MDNLLQDIVQWALSTDNVIALVITGSYARQSAIPDDGSDYDLELILRDPGQLAGDDTWIKNFRDVWIQQSFDSGQPYPTRLVIYEGGYKVDFTLADSHRITNMIKRGLDGNYSRGYRVLVDKTGLTKDLSPSASRHISQPLPTASEFHGAVNEFWFEAAHLPKYLLRDELWIVKFRDWTTKEALLKMLEWKVLLESDGATDIWYIGSHLREWIDSDTWTELQGVYSRFDRVDSWRGLIASMRLFRRISKEVAERAGFDYPQSTDDDITAYILSYEKRILDDSSREQFSS